MKVLIAQLLLVVVIVFVWNAQTHNVSMASDGVFGDQVDVSESTSESMNIINALRNVANVFAALVLTFSLIVLVQAGFVYVTAGLKGNGRFSYADNILKFRILYAGLGIAISLSAFALARLFASFSI